MFENNEQRLDLEAALPGEPGKARRIAAVAVYALLTVGIYALAVAGQLAAPS